MSKDTIHLFNNLSIKGLELTASLDLLVRHYSRMEQEFIGDLAQDSPDQRVTKVRMARSAERRSTIRSVPIRLSQIQAMVD